MSVTYTHAHSTRNVTHTELAIALFDRYCRLAGAVPLEHLLGARGGAGGEGARGEGRRRGISGEGRGGWPEATR